MHVLVFFVRVFYWLLLFTILAFYLRVISEAYGFAYGVVELNVRSMPKSSEGSA